MTKYFSNPKTMNDAVFVEYKQTGKSKNLNYLGMREMQARVYEHREKQYILLKSPPASGKSRALMFVALDKLAKGSVKKIIVAVPQRAIASSFSDAELKKYGFFADWKVNPKYNICWDDDDNSRSKQKLERVKEFLASDEKVIICAHPTLKNIYKNIGVEAFDDILVAIDEFHHSSAGDDSVLGNLVNALIRRGSAHILAMTGTYFRGDAVPVMSAEDEAKFQHISYTYYDQLSGYDYLKSLGIGYHFYQGKYFSALSELIEEEKKTIIYLPSVNSQESHGGSIGKNQDVDIIIDGIGEIEKIDENGIYFVKSHKTGKTLKIANLVDDDKIREKVVAYLQKMKGRDALDMIISLNMAKEGFDWPECEKVIVIGYRNSMTDIIQIIGRCTRDSEGKSHAQFVNLIISPDMEKTTENEVTFASNNMLKAISASLLMEQVLAPNFKFTPKFDDDFSRPNPGDIQIRGIRQPSEKVKNIVENDMVELVASIIQDEKIIRSSAANITPEVIVSQIEEKIAQKYPDLKNDDIKDLTDQALSSIVIKKSEAREEGGNKFVKFANGRFVNIDDLHIDLIRSINPFAEAFEILSKNFDAPTFRKIRDTIAMTKITMTEEEVMILYPKLKNFRIQFGKNPDINSMNDEEKRLAECFLFLENKFKENGK